MAWKEVRPMEERMAFVLRASREEAAFAEMCQEFGVSRKTGYKWLKRYRESGLEGMAERSRRPLRSPKRVEERVEALIIRERERHRKWGPKKLWAVLVDKYKVARAPAVSTIGALLKRHGLTAKRRGRRPVSQPSRQRRTEATRPNEVWAADFKGWFRTKDGKRCDPLTLSDLYSRYVLECRVVSSLKTETVEPVFRKVFRRYGLPEVIRVDNGSPFGSRGVCGLSKLSAGWVALGIRVEFIEPGHPEQNGVHERMHRTLKEETTRPPAANAAAQQRRFDAWRREFNRERPHEALGMQRPVQWYHRSGRRYTARPSPPTYPLHFEVRRVRPDGTIKWENRFRYVGEALAGVVVGLVEGADGWVRVSWGDLVLGYLVAGESGGLRPPASAPQILRETESPASPMSAEGATHVPG